MDSLNNTSHSPVIFILAGIPELGIPHIWISIPLCALYVLAFLGNFTILILIKTDRSLHTPMYFFLSMLAVTDLGLSLVTFPTMLRVSFFDSNEINFDSCLTQMLFLYIFSLMGSSVLLAMAFDRFIAICYPLSYASILTNSVISKIGVAIVVRVMALEIPVVSLLKRLTFCKTNLLSHSFCTYPDVMKLSCANTKMNSIFGLFAMLSTAGIDSFLIVFSYMLIMKTVLNMASREGRLKAFNTCVSHICVVLIFYMSVLGLTVLHRVGKNVPLVIYFLMGNGYLLLPSMLNPIIYSIKTKQIQKALLRIFSVKHNHV